MQSTGLGSGGGVEVGKYNHTLSSDEALIVPLAVRTFFLIACKSLFIYSEDPLISLRQSSKRHILVLKPGAAALPILDFSESMSFETLALVWDSPDFSRLDI